MRDWAVELQAGKVETAWDLFLSRYRRLIFAAIRHYAQDYDDVMDVFALVCEALREDEFRRLRSYLESPSHQARFSTWLVTVVRHLTIDWFRHRDGRRRLSAAAQALSPLRKRIFECVFLEGRSHIEAYELIRSGDSGPELTFGVFLGELRATYHAVSAGRGGVLLRELGTAVPLEDAAEAVVDARAASETTEALVAALGKLAPEDRVAVELYVIEQLPASDIARILKLPTPKAVYNRVYRALAALRAELERAGVQPGDL